MQCILKVLILSTNAVWNNLWMHLSCVVMLYFTLCDTKIIELYILKKKHNQLHYVWYE